MNFFEKILYTFQNTMATPQIFGWFHILWLLIIATAITLIIILRKRINEKGVKYTILTIGILLILFETMKQLIYSFNWNANTQTSSWNYQWYAFPFQFCSTPMYIMIVAGLCKKNLFRESLYAYLGTFALFGGLSVMFYPGDVFCSTIFINIQTMFWHGSIVVVGILLWVTNSIQIKQKTLIKASCVFAVMLAIAMILNYIWKFLGGLETGQTFNMFYISPFYNCTLPLLSIIYSKVPYIIFLLCYVFGFVLIAYLIILIAMAINKLKLVYKNKKKNFENR